MAWLRAFALFALLVAVPFLVEELLGKHPRMPIGPIKVGDSFWHDLQSYSGFGMVVLLFIGFLIVLFLFLPHACQISEWLTLAEREMNAQLRGWGGGWATPARQSVVKERAEWLSMIPGANPDVYKEFFTLNQNDLASGGPQGAAMGRARFTAFLLREIYEGNVRNAQLKIYNEIKNGGKPFIAPGIRQIVGYDKFDPNDVENNGFPPGAGVDWFLVMLTVKLYHHPRHIIMVKPDKTVVENWAVLDELNRQLRPVRV